MASLPFSGYQTVEEEKPPRQHVLSWEEFTNGLKTIDDDEHVRVRQLEQHLSNGEANPLWLEAREGRVTGSKVADIVGLGYENAMKFKKETARHDKRMTWKDIQALMKWNETSNYESRTLRKLLTSTFKGNEYTKWGNDHEDDCEDQFVFTHYDSQLATFSMKHYGLCISTDDGWMAMSPDGVIEEHFKDGSTGKHLCEWKCPWPYRGRYNNRVPKFQNSTNMYGPIQVKDGAWYPITLYYYCQVQWGMGLLQDQQLLHSKTMPGHCRWCGVYIDCSINAQHYCSDEDIFTHREGMYCYFGVWAPKDPNQFKVGLGKKANVFQEVSKIPFDEEFYQWMKRAAKLFWWDKYLPARHRQLYPKEFHWKGRTIQDQAPIFEFIHEQLSKQKKEPTQFVDWGSGEGRMLLHAKRNGYNSVLGFEREASLVKVVDHTVILDICQSVEENVRELNCRMDPSKPTVHFVYDGGIYPKELAKKIAESILAFQRAAFVCVVLSMWPANVEQKHFELRDWKKALEGYTLCRNKLDVSEANHVDPTMRAHLFYNKNI